MASIILWAPRPMPSTNIFRLNSPLRHYAQKRLNVTAPNIGPIGPIGPIFLLSSGASRLVLNLIMNCSQAPDLKVARARGSTDYNLVAFFLAHQTLADRRCS